MDKDEKVERIISGPIFKTVFSLALPVVIGMLFEFALHTTDYFWVGKLGANAQDAIMTTMVIAWTIFASFSLVTIGISAIIARFVGAKDFDQAKYFVKQGLSMSISLGIIVSVIGYIVCPYLIKFMGAGESTFTIAVPYIRIFFVSAVLYFLMETSYAIFRAIGDTKTPTIVGVGVVLMNMVLDPLLIFGYGPFPELGVNGASLASSISVFTGVIVIFRLILKGKLGFIVEDIYKLKPILKNYIRIGKIGLPMATQQFVFVSVYWFLIKIVHEFGESAGAAMGIGNRMESFSYLTSFGFSVAAATMVGQNLGANKPRRAEKCVWVTTGIAIGLTMFISVLFLTIPELIAGIFTSDKLVLKIATDYLIILGLSQGAMALEIVLEGSFGGAGDTIPPMVVMIPGAIIRIPLAYYLCFDLNWGINGVWWTLTFTSLAKAVVLAFWFKKGNWKLKEV